MFSLFKQICLGAPVFPPPKDNADPEKYNRYPIVLTCGCIAGSICLERSFDKSPRCPLCNTTIRIIAGVNAPRTHDGDKGSKDRLRQLELRSGVNEWPMPSVERTMEETEQTQTKYNLQEKLDVLNGCHGTFLSMRELAICISLVDFRLGTTTSVVNILDAFLAHPLFRWDREDAAENHDGKADFKNLREGDLRDVLMLVNMRAGTSFLLDELVMVLSLMNYVHVTNIRLLDVLGVSDADQPDSEGLRIVEKELVGAFGTLDLRVGFKHAVEDLGDVFSQARL